MTHYPKLSILCWRSHYFLSFFPRLPRLLFVLFRLPISTLIVYVLEVKHVEEVADGRHVERHVDVVVVVFRIWQIVAATVTELRGKHPVPFDEFHERGMLVIGVANVGCARDLCQGTYLFLSNQKIRSSLCRNENSFLRLPRALWPTLDQLTC